MNATIVKNYDEMSLLSARMIAKQVNIKPNCVLGLATGSTPIGCYQNLIKMYAAGEVTFRNVTTINLDEYWRLPPEHPESFRSFMNSKLFNCIDIPIENTNIPNGMAENAVAECERYDAFIEKKGGIDLQLLGIGKNGHIGFNEPSDTFILPTNQVKLSESTRKANSRFFDNDPNKVPAYALTMGIKAIMNAKRVLLLACKGKTEIIENAIYGPVSPKTPASILQLHPNLTVIYLK